MTKQLSCLILALSLIAVASQRAEAAENRSSGQLITVWEHVWEGAGSFDVTTADQRVPSYDDTQWTVVGPGSGSGACTTDQDCDDANACTTDTCDSNAPDADRRGCTYSSITCDDSNSCTTDSCDVETGCVFDISTETPACGGCDDGIDNDNDGDADAEDCACSTLCAQQRFAVVTTFVPSNFKRYALYFGSDISVDPSLVDLPFPTGGICITNGDYRAGADVGFVATTGSSRFGKGAVLDPDLDDEGDNDNDTGSNRVSIIRESFVSDGDPEVFKDSAPFVGPGACSQDSLMACTQDSDCGMGNDCTNQLTLTDPTNPNVDRTGTADMFTRCQNAQATVDSEATVIAGIAGNVPTLKGGGKDLKTSKSNPTVEITVGAGLQVIYVKRVVVAGKTTLRFVRDPMAVGPPTDLVIRVARQIRIGGEAKVELDGIDPERVIWNAEGPTGGRPKMLRASQFKGTLIAAQRRGVLVGGQVQVQGAIKARRVHLGQATTIVHTPAKTLLP